jgi:tryptophan aminotransferase
MISMLAGKPNPATFPFESIAITLKPSVATGEVPETLCLSGPELDAALQYGPTAGQAEFLNWVYQLQQRCHCRGKPEDEGWSCAIGAGSQELMEKVSPDIISYVVEQSCWLIWLHLLLKAFASVCDPEDTILMETPVYS